MALGLISSQFMWLINLDKINNNITQSDIHRIFIFISFIFTFILFLSTPWKWVSPILTVVNTIWIPLIWKNNNNRKIEDKENPINKKIANHHENSKIVDTSVGQQFTIKSRKYKKPLRYK
ncbi:hypothetical protein [Leuconostoc suionicum]|uniref:hypothetical protein n=1 Tax=Leuconostoc suionicum TaxID=1511761 RepID=UPI0024AE2765|nr:hypothetical protein [Leuconostoc suionicum]MDI6522874.1 hypothetical protein [Leuconostoc suionicum]